MGCCETRDEKKLEKKVYIPKIYRTGIRNINISDMKNQDTLIISETPSSELNFRFDGDACALELYVEWCYNLKKWKELALLIGDATRIANCSLTLDWNPKPTTIGCLSIIFLCKQSQINSDLIAPYIDLVLFNFIKAIKIGSDDYQQNSLTLLFYYLDSATEVSILRLVKFNIFGVLVRFMTWNNREMEYLAAKVCAKIYKHREYAQEEFLNVNGGFKLIHLLDMNKDNSEQILANLIMHLIDLLQAENGEAVGKIYKRINDGAIWDVLNGIDRNNISIKLMERIDTLMFLLV